MSVRVLRCAHSQTKDALTHTDRGIRTQCKCKQFLIVKKPRYISSYSAPSTVDGAMVICTFFLNNNCRYGNQCKKEHIDLR